MLSTLINKALSDEDIGTILGAYAKLIRYSELRHIRDLDELLTKDLDYCTTLYEDRPDRGHWTALSRYNGIYEHFDSYGNKPDKSLEWVNLQMRRRLNEATPYLTNLLHEEAVYLQQRQISRPRWLCKCVRFACRAQALQTEERRHGLAYILQLHEAYKGRVRSQLRYNRRRVCRQVVLNSCCGSLVFTCCAFTIWLNSCMAFTAYVNICVVVDPA